MLAKKLFGIIANLSLRAWVLAIGLALTLMPAQFSNGLNSINQQFFAISSYLVAAPKGGANIGLVLVPDDELLQWQQDINSAGKLGALLSNILHSSNATVGVLLPGTVDLGEGVADGLLQRIVASSTNSALIEEAEALVDRKQLLIDTLSNKRVVVASRLGVQSGQKPIPQQPSRLDRIPSFFHAWLWPPLRTKTDELYTQVPRSGLEHFPLLHVNGAERYLMGVGDDGAYYGDFLTYFLLAAAKSMGGVNDGNSPSFYWQPDKGLILGSKLIPTSASGRYLAFNVAAPRLAPLFNVMSLEEGLARGAFPDHVFIAANSSPHVRGYATATYSLLNNQTVFEPWWFVLVGSVISLAITLLLVFVVARLSAMSSALTVLLVFLCLWGAQVVLVVGQGVWLPLAAQSAWLLAGFVLVRVWRGQDSRMNFLLQKVDEAGVVLASGLIGQGQLAEVPAVLNGCSNSAPILQQYYELANAYAAKRQYRSSIDILQQITLKKRGFRDVEQKIKVMQSMLAAPSRDESKNSAAIDTTVVLEQDDIERPVMGRYQIRRELGRGAMGTVYLGYDPRIARLVAVKTLTYSQFQSSQLEGIKTRFFREAEAAGRLNHPNIVSVYDVGDEADLAFIAMDYVEGSPLSTFVDEGNLLPVFEVYRIMADVAAALEYAHGSHIVHRDIKPGNIMYNPSPYQVKVTDFGIARLVDDSKTSTGEILGSPLYMSPEQLKGKRVNHSADVFSLGVTFYQLLTGRLPFVGDNLASLTYEIIHGKHKGVRTIRKDLPASASRIINQCLQKDADERYESSGELAIVLKKAIKRDFASEARKMGYV
ncbi:serine/threonine-protein kinase [Teredinibacter purpureus]|uniref:serine/threonine-protein kinase n=1 Tax=Teredinibacter purpureus TaxID=2731756 RepID=UPI0005F77D55|nr:serine/threonine-protein kinase [Teredinibacter purpureus]